MENVYAWKYFFNDWYFVFSIDIIIYMISLTIAIFVSHVLWIKLIGTNIFYQAAYYDINSWMNISCVIVILLWLIMLSEFKLLVIS